MKNVINEFLKDIDIDQFEFTDTWLDDDVKALINLPQRLRRPRYFIIIDDMLILKSIVLGRIIANENRTINDPIIQTVDLTIIRKFVEDKELFDISLEKFKLKLL